MLPTLGIATARAEARTTLDSMKDFGGPDRQQDPHAESLHDRIFPSGDPRDGRIFRLDYVQTWESQFLGLGRTVRVLTQDVLTRNHAADDIGLSLVFLQRHRIEVGLKLVLERTAAPVAKSHKLSLLISRAGASCASAGLRTEWENFRTDQAEYIALMERADEDAATYRYPVDTKGVPWARASLVDVDVLAEAGKRFESALLTLVHTAEKLEPVPPTPDADATLRTLSTLSAACRAGAVRSAQTLDAFRKERQRWGGKIRAEEEQADAMVANRAVQEVSTALAVRVDRMVSRLSSATGITANSTPIPPAPPMPCLNPLLGPASLRAQTEAQMRWVVDSMIVWMRPMARAVRVAEQMTLDWDRPSARQLHLDIVRFRSRLGAAAPHVTWPEDD